MKFDLRTVDLVMRSIHWKEFFSLYLITPWILDSIASYYHDPIYISPDVLEMNRFNM